MLLHAIAQAFPFLYTFIQHIPEKQLEKKILESRYTFPPAFWPSLGLEAWNRHLGDRKLSCCLVVEVTKLVTTSVEFSVGARWGD